METNTINGVKIDIVEDDTIFHKIKGLFKFFVGGILAVVFVASSASTVAKAKSFLPGIIFTNKK